MKKILYLALISLFCAACATKNTKIEYGGHVAHSSPEIKTITFSYEKDESVSKSNILSEELNKKYSKSETYVTFKQAPCLNILSYTDIGFKDSSEYGYCESYSRFQFNETKLKEYFATVPIGNKKVIAQFYVPEKNLIKKMVPLKLLQGFHLIKYFFNVKNKMKNLYLVNFWMKTTKTSII